MSTRRDFEAMIAQRIELASTKTGEMVAGAPKEPDVARRHVLEDCGLAIALALGQLHDLKTAGSSRLETAQRDMNDAWRRMETAVRLVTGESPVTLVAALTTPSVTVPMTN